MILELPELLLLHRVHVSKSQSRDRLIRLGNIDNADVGEGRHDEAGNIGKRRLIVERSRQEGASLGENRQTMLCRSGVAKGLLEVAAGSIERIRQRLQDPRSAGQDPVCGWSGTYPGR